MRPSTATALGCAALLLVVIGFSAVAQTPVQTPTQTAPAAAPLRAEMRWPDREAMRAMMKTDEELVGMIAAEGFTEVRVTDRARHKIEVTARDADGRRIEMEVARIGAIIEFEVKDDAPAVNADLMRLLPLPVREAARSAGIVDIREFERSRRGITLEGRDVAGAKVEARLDAEARMRPGPRDTRRSDWRAERAERLDPATVRRVVEGAGYTVRGDMEFRRAHASVIAANPEGEVVELHIERGGEIVREQRRLDLD